MCPILLIKHQLFQISQVMGLLPFQFCYDNCWFNELYPAVPMRLVRHTISEKTITQM